MSLLRYELGTHKNKANTRESHRTFCFAFFLPSPHSEIAKCKTNVIFTFDSRIIPRAVHQNVATRRGDVCRRLLDTFPHYAFPERSMELY